MLFKEYMEWHVYDGGCYVVETPWICFGMIYFYFSNVVLLEMFFILGPLPFASPDVILHCCQYHLQEC